jgi:hypothetical protein
MKLQPSSEHPHGTTMSKGVVVQITGWRWGQEAASAAAIRSTEADNV